MSSNNRYTMTNSSGKQNLQVIVWEWENAQGRWRPYTPEVTQQLERAFMKNLNSVFLGDADPSLKNFCVVLSTWEQECRATNIVNKVRRSLYPQQSPAGQGAVWQWAGDNEGSWHTYDMCVQCVLEDTWTSGAQIIDLSEVFPLCPYVINFCSLIQKNKTTNYTRTIRRKTQASYPIGRPATPQQQANYPSLNTGPSPSASGISLNQSNIEHDRYKHKEDSDLKLKPDATKARGLFNKVLNLAGSSGLTSNKNFGLTHPVGSNGTRTDSAYAGHPAQIKGPMPLPRNATPVAPTPKPRTLFTLQDGAMGYPTPSYEQLPSQPQAGPSHRHTRVGSSERLFGSNHTLDSDCSGNYPGMRRPSIETISTYLSLESVSEDYTQQSAGSSSHNSDPTMDTLIRFDDSLSDDDVFSEDQEVKSYLMNGQAAGGLPSQDAMDYEDSTVNSRSHFVPISAPRDEGANPTSETKRKKTSGHSKSGHPAPFDHSHPSNGVLTRVMLAHENRGPTNHCEALSSSNNNRKLFCLREPKSKKDRLLINYTKPVVKPPDEECAICMCSLKEDSSYDSSTGAASSKYLVCPVISLIKCGHILHEECLGQLLSASSADNFLQCPICKSLHGEKWGIQPPGNMKVSRMRSSLPGHPGCGTIQLTYYIQPGIQGKEHPNPGRPYNPIGFPRTAYLPDSEKGQKVLRLLREAFRRRLIFTVGTSVTTGCRDAVTWNEIHHKTSISNLSGHGYPDPNYLDNVIEELKSHGVVED